MHSKLWWGLALVAAAAAFAAAENVELKLATPLAATLTDNYCLHTTPEAEAEVVMCLNKGAPLTLVARMKEADVVEGEEGHWYKAEVAGGAVGWVFSTAVAFEPVEGDATVGDSD
ncbi:MAG: SH3 domain-containing protein [Candidatus Coatesbacteria bacterium]|nr:MAG: SH3 domain-containing protein [Candidatus Coatesbacteria bacterium]